MGKICRLCAKIKEPEEIKTTLNNKALKVKQKLIDCCRWNSFEHSDNLPQSICSTCYRKLNQSWTFAQCIENAQAELRAVLLTKQLSNETKTEDLPNDDYDANDFSADYPQDSSDEEKDEKPIPKSSAKKQRTKTTYKKKIKPEVNETQYNDGEWHDIKDFSTFLERLKQAPVPQKETIDLCDSEVESKFKPNEFLTNFSPSDYTPSGTIKVEKIAELNLGDWSTFGFKCWKCHGSVETHDELLLHLAAHHPDDPVKHICPVCVPPKTYRLRRFYARHVIKSHMPHLRYCCYKCQQFYGNTKKLHIHVKGHRSETFKCICTECGKGFRTEADLRLHRRKHLPEHLRPIYECYLCNKHYPARNQLKNHMKSHSVDNAYFCEHCGRDFPTTGLLWSHKQNHQADNAYACDVCGKTFKRKQGVLNHKAIHSDEKPFKCDVCYREFKRNGCLQRHKLTHTTERSHACNYCEKRFPTIQTLTVHLRKHTGERPYGCTECSHRTSLWGNLNKHMLSKHGITAEGIRMDKFEA